jgi:hypothetical protein
MDHLAVARHGDEKWLCSMAAAYGAAVVVDGAVREVFGLVLHNKECISSMPLHENGEKLLQSGGSPKRVGGRRRGVVERWSVDQRWGRPVLELCVV